MRARMAIHCSQIKVELREILLKDKPAALLAASAKATVPVLVLTDGVVIDESLDIMYWALNINDPQHWLSFPQEQIESLIRENDIIFKIHLDHYKYAERFPEHTSLHYRQQGEVFLQQLETRLHKHSFLLGDTVSLADIALFPFIRQFAYVDINWFDNSSYTELIKWLHNWLNHTLFLNVMSKYPQWDEQLLPKDSPPVIF